MNCRADELPRASHSSSLGGRALNVLQAIGRTPLIALGKISPKGGAKIWGKAEFLNPAGSVKDRPALAMIQDAENKGLIGAGATLIEATSGNTGISLAMIAAVRGYRCILVMPEDMSVQRRNIMQAYGAETALTPAVAGMRGAVERAEQLMASVRGAFMPSQFENPSNPDSHYQGTGREIQSQLDAPVAAFVAGVGTGGTLTGVGRVLKQGNPEVRVVAVEPKGSAVLSGHAPGAHAIQGLGAGFVPDILDQNNIDEVLTVADTAASKMAVRLAKEEGLLVGPSAGANVHAASVIANRLESGHVVTILCDSGERYLF